MATSCKFKRLLVLAPHTDDGELGAGGLISKLSFEDIDKRYIAFSACEDSVPDNFPRNILAQEVKNATKCLGFKSAELSVLDFPVRHFPRFRQEILEVMVSTRKEFDPDLVLVPSSYDVHQDHQVINQEAIRAFRRSTLLGYELPWNCLEFRSDLIVELSEDDLKNKSRAFACYKSQAFRNYGGGDFLATLAALRGSQIGVERAESFEVIRWTWRSE